jgi:nicotinate phosphoribosyltransferase
MISRMGRFHIVQEDAIREGSCTDIYFIRTEEVLGAEGINPLVTVEIAAASLPHGWGVFCGLGDALSLLEGLPLDLEAMPEGSIFSVNEPVIRITGKYRDFARYETALLGFLCHASGIASAACRLKASAGDVPVYSFGSRRQHPALAPMIERAAWIGGVDGVSNTCAPEGIPLVGTMPHAFVMCYPRPSDAWASFDRHAPPETARVMLCDTYCDEKREALKAAGMGCEAVRLDTPRSRRGNMRSIIEEVRWELDAHGFDRVRIFLSGGLDQKDVIQYRDVVDAFGIGGAIANAPVIDFSMDIVMIEGTITAKRGKRSGAKQVYDFGRGIRRVLPDAREAPEGGTPLLERCITGGSVVKRPDLETARSRVIEAFPWLRKSIQD